MYVCVCMCVCVCIQGGVYYAVQSSMPGVQQIVYSVPVDSSASLLQAISDQPATLIQVHTSICTHCRQTCNVVSLLM